MDKKNGHSKNKHDSDDFEDVSAKEISDRLDEAKKQSNNDPYYYDKIFEVKKISIVEYEKANKNGEKKNTIRYNAYIEKDGQRKNAIISSTNETIAFDIKDYNNADLTNPGKAKEENNSNKRSIVIKKYSVPVPTVNNDGITHEIGPDGNPILPDKKYLSNIFRFFEHLDHINVQEVELCVRRGQNLVNNILEKGKTKIDDPDTIKELLDSVNHKKVGDICISDAQYMSIKNKFKEHGAKYLFNKITLVLDTKHYPVINRIVTSQKSENFGMELVNPWVKINLLWIKDYPNLSTKFLDRTKKIYKDNKFIGCAEATDADGNPISRDSVIDFIVRRSNVHLAVRIGLCSSRLGNSFNRSTAMIAVKRPKNIESSSNYSSQILGYESEEDDRDYNESKTEENSKVVEKDIEDDDGIENEYSDDE